MVEKQKIYKCSNFKNCGKTTQERSSNFYECLDCKKWTCYDCSHWGDGDSRICVKCRLCNGCDKNALEAKCDKIGRCGSCLDKGCSDCGGGSPNDYCNGCYEKDQEDLKEKKVDFKEKVSDLVDLLDDITIDNEYYDLTGYQELKDNLEKANKGI